jgi:hypothetical protein
MSAPLQARVRHPVSVSKSAQTLQMLQGAYYVFAGLVTAVAVEVWEPPTDPRVDLTHYWALRAVGLGLAGFGAYLAYSGYKGGRAPAGIGLWVALALTAIETGGIALGKLPTTFLIDVTVQAVCLVSWVAIMFRQVNKQVERTGGADRGREPGPQLTAASAVGAGSTTGRRRRK